MRTRLVEVNVTTDPWTSVIIMKTYSMLDQTIVRLYEELNGKFIYVRSAALSIKISATR
jgi:hypothetical protein